MWDKQKYNEQTANDINNDEEFPMIFRTNYWDPGRPKFDRKRQQKDLAMEDQLSCYTT